MTPNYADMQFQAARHKELMAAAEARLGTPLAWLVRCTAEITWLANGLIPPANIMGENGKEIESHLEMGKNQLILVLSTLVEKVLPSLVGHPVSKVEACTVRDEITTALSAIYESEYRVLLAGRIDRSPKPGDE